MNSLFRFLATRGALIAALVPAFVAGCGGGGLDPILGSPSLGGPLTDSTRPTVTLTVPAAGATAVPINTKITVTFSEAMAPATISDTTFKLTNTTLGAAVAGTVSYSAAARTASFTPTGGVLAAGSQFSATVTSATTDLAGNALAGNTAVLPNAGDQSGRSPRADGRPHRADRDDREPSDGNTAVCSTKSVRHVQRAMDPVSIDTTTFVVTDSGSAVAGTVTYDAPSRVASFVPSNAAGFATGRTLVVTARSGSIGVKDLAGNPLAVDRVWGFTTGTQACAGSVNLRTAAAFGAFGGAAGVTNQGINTVVGGNLGTTAACTLITASMTRRTCTPRRR